MLLSSIVSAVEDQVLAHDKVDQNRAYDIGKERVCRPHTESLDEVSHERGADSNAEPGHCVEKQYLHNPVVPTRLEHPHDVKKVCHHVGNKESQPVIDHRIAGPDPIVQRRHVNLEEPHKGILGLQRGQYLPCKQMEYDDVCCRCDAAGYSVFDELDKRPGLSPRELLNDLVHGKGSSLAGENAIPFSRRRSR